MLSVALGVFRRSQLPFAILLFAAGAQASEQRLSIPGSLMTKPIILDGSVDAEEWAGAAAHQGVYFDSETGRQEAKPVSIWLAYDHEAIYFAAKVLDDPKSLIKTQYRANSALWRDDHVELTLDPSGTGSSFCTFASNPSGATSIYLAGGRAAKAEWQGGFTAKSRISDEGWSCEMVIPWKILPLPSPGKKDILVQVSWNDTSDERSRSLAYTEGKTDRTPRWTGVEVPKIEEERLLRLLPYGYAGYDQTGQNRIFNGGLDFKTSLGRQGQLVGTINPDFRNIENRVLGLGFSYFERLAGESRPFFLEGQDFLSNGTGDIFASQRIGVFDAGLKAYGKLSDKSNYALITTQDFGRQSNVVASYENAVTPDSGFALGLVSSQRKGLNSHAGQLGARITQGSMTYSGSLALTDDEVFGSGSSISANVGHSRKGSSTGFGYSEVSAGFFPRLGFSPDRGFRSAYLYHGLTLQPKKGEVRSLQLNASTHWSEKLNGDPYQLGMGAFVSGSTKSKIGLELGYQQLRFLNSIDHVWSWGLDYPSSNPNRRISIGGASGSLARADYTNLGLSGTYRLSPRLVTSLSTQFEDHYQKSRQTIFNVTWDLGGYQDFGGRMIARNGKVNWHLTWRKAGREGSEFFVILGDPNAPEFRRSLIVKAVFPLSLKY